MVLSSRPLTYIAIDDSHEPLTPSHLLVGQQLMNFPDHLAINHEVNNDGEDCQLSARLRHLNRFLDVFWRRWRRVYLLESHEAHRHHCSSGNLRQLKAMLLLPALRTSLVAVGALGGLSN